MKMVICIATLFLLKILRTMGDSQIVIDSMLPNTKTYEFIIGICPFDDDFSSWIGNETVVVMETLPPSIGCVRKKVDKIGSPFDKSFLCVDVLANDTLSNICNTSNWRLVLDTGSIGTTRLKGGFNDSVIKSHIMLTIINDTNTINVTKKITIKDTSQNFLPLFGLPGYSYMNYNHSYLIPRFISRNCQTGHYITSISGFRQDKNGYWSGLKLTCTNGNVLSISGDQRSSTAGSIKVSEPCVQTARGPVNGIQLDMTTNMAPLNFRLSCSNYDNNEWLENPTSDDIIIKSYTCPPGNLADGATAYSGNWITAFSINCKYIPFAFATISNTLVVYLESPYIYLSDSTFTADIEYGSINDILFGFDDKFIISEVLDESKNWVAKPSVTLGKIKNDQVRLRISSSKIGTLNISFTVNTPFKHDTLTNYLKIDIRETAKVVLLVVFNTAGLIYIAVTLYRKRLRSLKLKEGIKSLYISSNVNHGGSTINPDSNMVILNNRKLSSNSSYGYVGNHSHLISEVSVPSSTIYNSMQTHNSPLNRSHSVPQVINAIEYPAMPKINKNSPSGHSIHTASRKSQDLVNFGECTTSQVPSPGQSSNHGSRNYLNSTIIAKVSQYPSSGQRENQTGVSQSQSQSQSISQYEPISGTSQSISLTSRLLGGVSKSQSMSQFSSILSPNPALNKPTDSPISPESISKFVFLPDDDNLRYSVTEKDSRSRSPSNLKLKKKEDVAELKLFTANLLAHANLPKTLTDNGNVISELSEDKSTLCVSSHLMINIKKNITILDKEDDTDENDLPKVTGSTARVEKGRANSKGGIKMFGKRDLAIKFFNAQVAAGGTENDNFAYEVYLMSILPKNAINLIELLGYSITEKALIMPYYEITLSDYIRKSKFRLAAAKLQKIAKDIAEGMRALHDEAKILHLDLKPKNVLVDDRTSMTTCIITDFGYSNAIGDDIPVARGVVMPKHAGLTYPYAAPEIFNMNARRFNHEEDKPIDVYAYAMTMYEVVIQQVPWKGLDLDQIKNSVSSGKRLPFEPKSRFDDIPKIIDEIKKCWSQSPSDRPSFQQVCDSLKN